MYFVPALLLSYYTFDLKLYSSLEDYGLQKMADGIHIFS